MSAMILVSQLPLQPRMLLVFSVSCLLLFILPLFACADSPAGVMNIMEEGINKTRSSSKLNPQGILLPARRRTAKYTNRRFLDGEICSKFDISIFQGPGSPLPNGIPTFSVQIFNLCTVGCPISNVHVACGWFASAKLVNPKVFRRLKYNDCLVNDGNPIPYGDSITFQYANSFAYQLRVETAVTWLERSPANMLSSDQMVHETRYVNHRILAPNVCTSKDISITQNRDGSVGIPQYTVQIVNTCMSECAPSDIHVYCGWFASSPPPNPTIFTRIAFDDCLVNNGKSLSHGSVIQFQYANSFMYPLRFKSAVFCR